MSEAFSEGRAISDFTAFMITTVRPKHSLTVIPDGKLHRFSVEGDKGGQTSGAYCLRLDNPPAGFVQDWKHGIKETWRYDFDAEERREYGRQQHSPEERAKYEAARREAEHKKEEELRLQREKQQQARAMALAEYKAAVSNPESYGIKRGYISSRFGASTDIYIPNRGQSSLRYNHDYTEIVQFPMLYCTGTIKGGICKKGELLVPFVSVTTGKFQTLQRISDKPDSEGKYTKRFYTGLSPKGAAHWLIPEHSENVDTLFVVEGVTTALAVMVDTGGNFPVFSTGSCGNLAPVCEGLRTRYSKRKIIIVADNDEAGITAANKCKNEGLADGIRMPETAGHDWYDDLLRRKKGI